MIHMTSDHPRPAATNYNPHATPINNCVPTFQKCNRDTMQAYCCILQYLDRYDGVQTFRRIQLSNHDTRSTCSQMDHLQARLPHYQWPCYQSLQLLVIVCHLYYYLCYDYSSNSGACFQSDIESLRLMVVVAPVLRVLTYYLSNLLWSPSTTICQKSLSHI